jgi:hypothetical protein
MASIYLLFQKLLEVACIKLLNYFWLQQVQNYGAGLAVVFRL